MIMEQLSTSPCSIDKSAEIDETSRSNSGVTAPEAEHLIDQNVVTLILPGYDGSLPDCWNSKQYESFKSKYDGLLVKGKNLGCSICATMITGAHTKSPKAWREFLVGFGNGKNRTIHQAVLRKKMKWHFTSKMHRGAVKMYNKVIKTAVVTYQIDEKIMDSSTSIDVPDSSTSVDVPDSSTTIQVPDSNTNIQEPDSNTTIQEPDSNTSNQVPDSNTSNQVPDSNTSIRAPDSSTKDSIREIFKALYRLAKKNKLGSKYKSVKIQMDKKKSNTFWQHRETRQRSERHSTSERLEFPETEMEYRNNIRFVQEIEKKRCLYDYNIEEYSRRDITDQAWNEIALKMNCTVRQCKERWKNLRSVFCRNIKNDKKNSRPYYLFKYMMFLEPFLKNNQINDSMQSFPMSSNGSGFFETSATNEDETFDDMLETADVDIKREIEDNLSNEMPEVENYCLESRTPKNENHCFDNDARRMYILSLLPEINEMSEQKFRRFKRLVLKMIDQLNEESSDN